MINLRQNLNYDESDFPCKDFRNNSFVSYSVYFDYAGCLLVQRGGIDRAVFAMIVIINIERIIHSTYTLTADGNLVIYNGRFQKEKTIPLSRITDVELKRLFGLKHLRFTRYVLVHYDNDKVIDLLPEKPEEFMNALVRRLEHKEEDEDTFEENM